MLVAGGIILNGSGQILLAQRPPGKHLAGLWEFPGGKVEPGETAREALVRELQEELQINVEVTTDLGVFPHLYEWGTVDLHVFVVRALGEPQLTEAVANIHWLSAREIETSKLAPADVAPLEEYLRRTGLQHR